MCHSIKVKPPEAPRIEVKTIDADTIDPGILYELLTLILQIKDSVSEDSSTSEENVIQLIKPWLIECLTAKSRPKAEVILYDHVEEVLVKVVADNKGDSSIGFSTMKEKKRSQKFKLAYCIVTGSRCLHAFLAGDTNPDVRLHYHRHIICTIANGQRHLLRVLLSNHLYDVTFLLWRDSTAYDNVREVSDCEKRL